MKKHLLLLSIALCADYSALHASDQKREQDHKRRSMEDQLRQAAQEFLPPELLRIIDEYTQQRSFNPTSTIFLHGSTPFNSVQISPDGTMMVTTSMTNVAHIWDTQNARHIRSLAGHTDYITYAAFSPDGRMMVTTSIDGTARIWNTHTGETLHIVRGHGGPVLSANFSPDGRMLVTTSGDETARILDTATGTLRHVLKGHNGPVLFAHFSPDGNTVATASEDRTVRLWNVQDGKQIELLSGYIGPVNSIIFSPDGALIVTAADEASAPIFNAKTHDIERVLVGHTGAVTYAAASPDSQEIVTTSVDGTVRVWDVQTGKLLQTLTGHTGAVRFVTFSPYGNRIASAGADKTVRMWERTPRLAPPAQRPRTIAPGMEEEKLTAAVQISPEQQEQLLQQFQKLRAHKQIQLLLRTTDLSELDSFIKELQPPASISLRRSHELNREWHRLDERVERVNHLVGQIMNRIRSSSEKKKKQIVRRIHTMLDQGTQESDIINTLVEQYSKKKSSK